MITLSIGVWSFSMIHEGWTYPRAAITVEAFQVSEQMIEPVDTFRVISGRRVSASTSSTTSARTVPLRHKIPKPVVL